jgi:hypothetical protein
MTTMTSFAAIASLPAVAAATASPSLHDIPTGPWTLHVHETEEKKWDAASYKQLHVAATWEELGAVFRELGPRTLKIMSFAMRGSQPPRWENKENIAGGSYSFLIPHRRAVEVYQIYVAAAATDTATLNPANKIVGVTMSPKKGHCVIKLWNASAKAFNKPTDIAVLDSDVRADEISFMRNTDRSM